MIHLHSIQFNSQFSFNVLLHLTILYTILSLLFMNITKVSSDAINGEINSIIEDIIKDTKIKIKENETIIKKKILEGLEKTNPLREKIENNSIFNLIKDNETLKELSKKYNMPNLVKYINNLSIMKNRNNYNYWLKIFKKDDSTREKNNNQVFFYIKFVNVLLVSFLLFFAYYIYVNKTITINDFKVIILENILTFIGVGVVEYLFFTNVASKYIPVVPSQLYELFITTLKNNLSKYIV